MAGVHPCAMLPPPVTKKTCLGSRRGEISTPGMLYVYGYAEDGSHFPQLMLWPGKAKDGGYIVGDSVSGALQELRGNPAIKCLDLEHLECISMGR